ncbi:hypothetical protein J2Z76_002609 [Sedimentibacter acidaminivorans]|uniref:Toprim domain-containing protein n=1 Tax=Sedimentibacter acidaminivorans TaxID=913099 RepID=A0ABS4GGG3_9FIRM|nr:DUF3991 and toprim domain-containing protein [Sedimentibacter acidaminivorans]MBP1926739.1 hypothetical protein [Sedimentibacter acidaminivorans]
MYTKYEISKAQNISLLDYIESRGYELIYSHTDVRLKEHDSLVISNNKWKWFSRNKGGGTLDFLIEYEGKNFKEAMQTLLGEKGIDESKPQYKEHIQKQHEIKQISELPEKNNSYRRLYAYLSKTRGIDVEIINDMVNYKVLYEEKEHNNCVFLGRDKAGEVKYCLKVGTNTFKKFKGEIPGSDKRFNVELYSSQENKSVCIYESIIDAMSHATLIKQRGLDYKNQNRVSLGGVSDLKLEQYLKDNPNIKKIVVGLDNDEAGIEAGLKIKDKYTKLGYEVTKIVPKHGKDFNDELVGFRSRKSLKDINQGVSQYKSNANNKLPERKDISYASQSR